MSEATWSIPAELAEQIGQRMTITVDNPAPPVEFEFISPARLDEEEWEKLEAFVTECEETHHQNRKGATRRRDFIRKRKRNWTKGGGRKRG